METLPSRNKEKQPSLLLAETAQNIYNRPKEAQAIADELYETLVQHYSETGMRQADADRAHYLELRGPWNALLAPLLHAIEIELIEAILPLSVTRGLLASPKLIEEPIHDESFGQVYAGNELSIMRAITQWNVAVTEWFWEDVQQFQNHWARPVLDAFAAYHSAFCEAEATQKNGWRRRTHPLDAILELAIDSSETAIAALMPLVRHYMKNDEEWQLKDRAGTLLAQTEELSWASSVTRNFLGDYLGRRWQPQKTNPFSEPGHGRLWRLPSLKDGPWPVPRYCPASIPLISPFEQERTLTRLALGRSHISKDYSISAAELRLISLAHIVNEVESFHPPTRILEYEYFSWPGSAYEYAHLMRKGIPTASSPYDIALSELFRRSGRDPAFYGIEPPAEP